MGIFQLNLQCFVLCYGFHVKEYVSLISLLLAVQLGHFYLLWLKCFQGPMHNPPPFKQQLGHAPITQSSAIRIGHCDLLKCNVFQGHITTSTSKNPRQIHTTPGHQTSLHVTNRILGHGDMQDSRLNFQDQMPVHVLLYLSGYKTGFLAL